MWLVSLCHFSTAATAASPAPHALSQFSNSGEGATGTRGPRTEGVTHWPGPTPTETVTLCGSPQAQYLFWQGKRGAGLRAGHFGRGRMGILQSTLPRLGTLKPPPTTQGSVQSPEARAPRPPHNAPHPPAHNCTFISEPRVGRTPPTNSPTLQLGKLRQGWWSWQERAGWLCGFSARLTGDSG